MAVSFAGLLNTKRPATPTDGVVAVLPHAALIVDAFRKSTRGSAPDRKRPAHLSRQGRHSIQLYISAFRTTKGSHRRCFCPPFQRTEEVAVGKAIHPQSRLMISVKDLPNNHLRLASNAFQTSFHPIVHPSNRFIPKTAP
jgi:hypothetical protein